MTSVAGANHDGNYAFFKTGITSSSVIGLFPLEENGTFCVYDALTLKSIGMTLSANTWYHLRVDFECEFGGYMGLTHDTWRLL